MPRSLDPSTLRAFLEEFIDGTGPRPRRRFGKSRLTTVTAPLAMSLLVAACSGESDAVNDGEAGTLGEGRCAGSQCDAECQDGLDNDGDGAADCEDASCADQATCSAVASGGEGGVIGSEGGMAYGIPYQDDLEYDCTNRLDDDGDGVRDCSDRDCASDPACLGGEGGAAGTGGVPGSGGTPPAGGVPSTGGIATGGNPATGAAPSTGGIAGAGGVPNGGYYVAGGAYGIPFEDCDNDDDDDGDERVDCADPDCAFDESCAGGTAGTAGTAGAAGAAGEAGAGGASEICDDEIDNDDDGDTDCADQDCFTSGLCEFPVYGIPFEEDCADGVDNDFDGATDCADEDCLTASVCGGEKYAAPID